ncbi:hypothetical protein QR680_008315 [Steinernema hermaphroditum]|uniref:AMP-dependent synthetase/ligase domain-containing protein n=1 Tax=Steinernema hermaphroditum TaxID=289476 RepID=A0AA39IHN3_9BILA|nr:hypothetical protein QR680_008315 [Steinernema hermaphroditum]
MTFSNAVEELFCIDFTRPSDGKYVPHEVTIPELIYRKKANERVALVFDSEKVTFSFEKLKNEMEALAAGLLSTLQPGDRVLICGYNHSNLMVAALAAIRAGLVFCLASPNFTKADQLERLLKVGEFRAIICFSAGKEADRLNSLLNEFCPELRRSSRGALRAARVPKLTHVILAEEDHKHAGTYTLSEIYGRSSRDKIEKLPKYATWDCHQMVAIQFTMGSTGESKAVALSHYQLVNGCRTAALAIGITRKTVLSCALPLFKLAVFSLATFSPFLFESSTVISEPSPLPRFLFSSIDKFQCTSLLTNGAALRLLLKMAATQKVRLPTLNTVILLGERVSAPLLTSIGKQLENAKRIAVGMLLTETGSVPLLSDNTTNLLKSVGKPLDGYEVDILRVEGVKSAEEDIGELAIRPIGGMKFLGYGPNFEAAEWIRTGDIAVRSEDGNVEIVTHKNDLIFDKANFLVEHWRMERVMAQNEQIRGVQVISLSRGAPVMAIIIPKDMTRLDLVKSDLCAMCKNNKVRQPDTFAMTGDFPRVNTKILKYKLREMLQTDEVQII